MSLQSISISGYKAGAEKNKKPFLLTDDAFAELYNAYVWREECRKWEGLQLIGRYRRVLTNQAQVVTDGTNDYNITDLLSGVRATEPNAELEPGSIVITLDSGGANETRFRDQNNGTFLRTAGVAYQITTGTFVNYLTGEINLEWDAGGTPGAGVTVVISFNYFPRLPAMGIPTREIAGINDEQAMWFDTKYCYIHDGANFQDFLSAENATWNGTDSDFFWGTNYRGSDSQTRLFFVTNFVNNAGSPMRYTDGTTWEEFQPIIGGTSQTDILSSTLVFGSAAFGPAFLTKLPIVEGTVVITVSENEGEEDDIVFTDTPKDGTLVSSGLNTGTINYATGQINLSFNPVLPGNGTWTVTAVYNQAGNFLFSARILIPYYGRLLALNTWEGISRGSAVNIFNRVRFSQIGSPVQQDAWRSDVFGKGGFIDAPVNEDIISATFYKNTLIVFFERSTWRLQYIGEYGMPFIWERISSDFGSESTFSPILFDNGVLAVGDKAIVASSGGDVQRVDLQIPDTVYAFKNADEGVKRVHGIRDFKKELAFWCYPDYPFFELSNQYFPNKTVVYNYRNNTYAFLRNNVTCFGNFQYPADITWDRLDIFWDDFNVFWDGGAQAKYPVIASGNQQGFAHFYGYRDVEGSVDSTIDAMHQESLAVTAVTVTGGVVTLKVPNHNLVHDEIVYLTGLIYLVTATSTPGSTTLNNTIYSVQVVDKDTLTLFKWDEASQNYYNNINPTNIGTYIGGGVIALFPNIEIRTKDFNPAKQAGLNVKTSYIDFLFDVSTSTAINVLMRMNASDTADGNVLIGNKEVETCNTKTGVISNVTLANPCVITSKNHSLLNGNTILIDGIVGTTELNGNTYTVTFLTTDTFSINVDSSLFTAYQSSGFWVENTDGGGFYTLGSQYAWHRFFATCFGQYLSLVLSYNNSQMNQIETHRQMFVLNAMQIYYRTGGKNIFGR